MNENNEIQRPVEIILESLFPSIVAPPLNFLVTDLSPKDLFSFLEPLLLTVYSFSSERFFELHA